MIRDPSDGTVREMGDVNYAQKSAYATEKPVRDNGLMVTSALPIDKLKAEELARLEASREWIIQRNRRASD